MIINVWCILKLFILFYLSNNFSSVICEDNEIVEMVKAENYPLEEHTVTTKDDYILNVHRIPASKMKYKPNGKVAFIMHGLLSSSVDFVVMGANKSLAYVLADKGYDVWLGNARGNTWSRKHRTLNPDEKMYWEYSWHEIGKYDLPAMIDYILNETGKSSLHYIGHSQGGTTVLVYLSLNPENEKKITTLHLLGVPASFTDPPPFMSFLVRNLVEYEDIIHTFNMEETLPVTGDVRNMGTMFCRPNSDSQKVCILLLNFVFGRSNNQFDSDEIPKILQNLPAGASYKQLIHYLQAYKSGQFLQYDFGIEANQKLYKQKSPPLYDLSKISTKTQVVYAEPDGLVSPKDSQILVDTLGNKTVLEVIKLDDFNHIDMLFGKDARKEIYDKIINFIETKS